MQFFQAVVVSKLLYECTTWMLTKHMEKKLDSNYTRMQQLYGHLPPIMKLTKLDEPDMWDTAGEVRLNSYTIYSCEPLHMDKQRSDDQPEPIYNSSVLIQDITWKTSWERWMIEMGDERGSGRSKLVARHGDDEIYIYKIQLFITQFHAL